MRRSEETLQRQENRLEKDIVKFLNGVADLGCKVSRIRVHNYNLATKSTMVVVLEKGVPEIFGSSRDGRAIFIKVKSKDPQNHDIPVGKYDRAYLCEMYNRKAIVGVAYDLGDAYDIVADSAEYPRKQRTYAFLKEKPPRVKKAQKCPLAKITGLDIFDKS